MLTKTAGNTIQIILTLAIFAIPAFAVTVERKMMAGYVDTNVPCNVPTETRFFLNSDQRVWLWFRVNGAATGDRIKAEWVSPGGAIYLTANWNPLTSGGTWCLWAYLDLANTEAASQPGVWTVRAYYNNSALFNQSFSVLSLSHLTTRAVDTAACNQPVEAQAFSTADERAWLWFTINGVSTGDRFRIEWDSPDGSRYRAAYWNPLANGGSWCFWDRIAIAGDTPASLPGQWNVRIYYNDSFLFSRWFFISVVRHNSTLAFQVGPDGRFNAGAFPNPQTGFEGANSYGIMYRWPETPSTSFTTIRVDGQDAVYGEDGVKIESPYNTDAKTNRSRWRVGDIEITQILQLALNNQTGREDVIRISYFIRNAGSVQHSVGGRVMIDTDINLNDGVPFRVPGVGIVRKEMEFTGASVPDSFQAFFDVTDTRRVTLSMLRGGGATAPDRLMLASWPRIFDTLYDYTIDSNFDFTVDSAYAIYWNPRPLAPGESRVYTTFYGLSSVQVDPTGPLALGVSGPASLAVVNNQYSPNPFDITATIQNTSASPLTNAQLTLNLPPGLGLAGGIATITVGDLPAGQERQFSWRVATGPRTGAGMLTYSVTASAANAQSKTVSRTITLPTISVTHSLSGTVGIWDGRELWKLDGDTLKLTVSARHASNGSIEKELQFRDGTYSFDNLPSDTYNIVAKLEYKDEVTVDNRKFPRGCVNQSLPKDTEIKVNSVEVRGKTEANIDFPPPVVMVHGYPSCYDKWYQKPEANKPDPKLTHWDNFARALGGITFTPNYDWHFLPSQSSWNESMKNVEEQVANNFKRLTKDIDRRGGRFPGWFYIAHSTGGLVGRVLVYQNEESKLVQALKKIYLLGTPNSGAYGRAWVEYFPFASLLAPEPGRETYPIFYYISENAIRTEFNRKYRSFRNKEVMVFAGNINSFFVPNADGVVRVDSVYNIETQRNVISFRDLGRIELSGETFSFQHDELGSLASLKPILIDKILPDITRIAPPRTQTPSMMSDEIKLAATHGTSSNYADAEPDQTNVGFSSAQLHKVLTGGQTLAAAQTATNSFTVGVTDLAIVNPLVVDGVATFALVDPAGRTIPFAAPPPDVAEKMRDEFGETLILRNPTPGQWQLRTTAGRAGATFIFLVMENSPVEIEAEVKETSLAINQTTTIGARVYGNLQQVGVTARVINATGNDMGTVTLFDDGRHQDGAANDGVFAATTPPLTSSGRHYVVVTANGVFNGRPVARQSEAAIDVLGPSRLLSGSFKDAGYDAGNDGRLDAVRVTVGFSAPAAGSYLLSADLLDTQGFLLTHAVGSVEASTAGSYSANLDFYLTGKVCGQFSGDFMLRNVTLSSGADFRTLDVWNASVSTQRYDGEQFNCSSASLSPRPLNVQPEAMFPGSSGQVLISGSGFAAGLRVSFGAGVTVAAVTRVNSNLLAAQISVAANATPGARELNIANPDGISTTVPGLFSVASDRPPTVNFSYPADRQAVRGTVTASAAAEDDRGIQKVEFYLDGQVVVTDTDFPYQFVWNTSASGDGNHTLTAKAFDTLGQTRGTQITVGVGNHTVASVSAASFASDSLAAESIVAAFGTSLATSVRIATSVPLPTSLAGTTVKVKDSVGSERLAPLFFVAPTQVNYQIPPGTASGTATITITSGDSVASMGTAQIVAVAPGLFTANSSGQGVAAAIALRVKADGSQSFEPVAQFDSVQKKFIALPIDMGPPTDQIFLLLFGTGWRLNSGLPSVTIKVGGIDAEVLYAGPQGGFVGLDQLNVRVPRSLAGRGEVDLMLTIGGKAANTVKISFR